MAGRLRLGVVGVGHLGKEHARILAGMSDVELVGVADPNGAQAGAVADRCGARAYPDHRALFGAVDAVVVAAPTVHHHAVAGEFLSRGVHALVEKPLTADPGQADELVSAAGRHGAVLQVGHVERFNPAFEELQRRPLRPRYIAAERCGGFTGRSVDVGAVLDLMVHDLDLVLTLVRAPVRSVEALGVSVLSGHEDVARARVTFVDGCVADLTASRVHPAPVRRMQVWGAEGFAGVDFACRKLTLAQPSAAVRAGRADPRHAGPEILASLRTELFGRHLEILEVECSGGDQLTAELRNFLDCIRSGGRPRVGGEDGRAAVALASRVIDSLRLHAWEGGPGPAGPSQLPAPVGRLFEPPAAGAAA